jgi:hypothetical protein
VSALLQMAALGLTAAGVLAAVLGGASTRSLRGGLPIMMDLLTAAGLLRLSAEPQLDTVASAAAIVGVRRLVILGLGMGKIARASE